MNKFDDLKLTFMKLKRQLEEAKVRGDARYCTFTYQLRGDQLEALFELLEPRVGPETAAYAPGNKASKAAAKKIEPKLHKIRGRVFDFIKQSGDVGATGSEIAYALDVLPYTAKPRCTELKDWGYIKDSGLMRNNDNEEPETVWLWTGKERP